MLTCCVLSSLCVVPVTLTLSNCSTAKMDVVIDLQHRTSRSVPKWGAGCRGGVRRAEATSSVCVMFLSPECVEAPGPFAWVGQSRYRLQLEPEEVLRLPLRACFLQAGVYNLNTPRVFAKPSEQAAVCERSQQTAAPALIIITNA